MELFVFLLIAGLVGLWLRLSRMIERVNEIERTVLDARDQIRVLQAQVRDAPGATAPTATAPPAPPPAPDPVVTPRPPVVAEPRPPAVVPAVAAKAPAPAPPRPPLPPSPPRRVAPPEPAPVASTSAARADSWELTVGTSWLNKIGVLVFVIGVALLVGYSFTHIGPAGRVAIGYLLSASMLVIGVWLERRDEFRNYAYGLVAGGWAGIYFTTFAMHEVPAAKLVDSELTAVTLLTLVAGGMIAHSLRYRSEVVTSLTFIVAYVTLALSPLSGFSLAASVPLAMSLLVVSQRLGWPSISALGIIATYGAFILRGAVFPGGAMDAVSPIPYVTLAAYWLTFEAADLIGLRARRTANPANADAPVSMLALNAAGVLGALVVMAPANQPALMSTMLFATGAAYIVTAVLRAWLLPGRRQFVDADRPFDVAHAASAIGVALFAIAIGLRFAGRREALAWLLETQLLFVAGMTLRDRWLRRFASIVAMLVSLRVWILCLAYGRDAGALFQFSPEAAIAVMVAMIWYANRETVRIRGSAPTWTEPAYSWIATALLATAAFISVPPAYQGLAAILLAVLLLEAGLRRDAAYSWQSYFTGALGAYATMVAFASNPNPNGWLGPWGPAPSPLDEWLVLPIGVAAFAAGSARLARSTSATAPGARIAAAASLALATMLTMAFEWRVLPADAVAPAWALTGLALVALGAARHVAPPRWLGYAAVAVAALRQMAPLLARAPLSGFETAAGAVVIVVTYAAAYFGRRSAAEGRQAQTDLANPEIVATAMLGVAATASFVLFKYRVLPESMVAPAWALTGLVLAALGDYRQRAGQRWQGYVLAMVASALVLEGLLEVSTAVASQASGAAAVTGFVYATAVLARRSAIRGSDQALVASALSALGTVVLATLQSRVMGDLTLGPSWMLLGIGLVGTGFWHRLTDVRWQGYLMLAVGTLRAGRPVFVGDATAAAIWWLGACLVAVYAMSLTARRLVPESNHSEGGRQAENFGITSLLVGASGVLASLIIREVQPSAVTLALGLQGLALMVTGLAARERVLRISGLVLLLGCLLKLFFYDLRELEPLPRIFSFVVLGLVLLGISWVYTRYRDRIMKLL